MQREKNSTVHPLVRELFTLGVYKRSQGRITRQVTFAALALALLIGAWRLSVFLVDAGPTIRFLVPSMLVAVGLWLCFRVVNLPRFADFLIAVEAEINKVSWPSKGELIRSTVVVLITIFALAAILFFYDFMWRFLLEKLGVIGGR